MSLFLEWRTLLTSLSVAQAHLKVAMGRYCRLTCELGGCEPATSRPSEAAASATAALYAADFLARPLLRHPPTDPHDHGMAAAARGT